MLIGQAWPELDASFHADALLAPLAANLITHRGLDGPTVKAPVSTACYLTPEPMVRSDG